MVNKGQIHREIRYFREIFWDLIKSDDELVIEIRENDGFRKITPFGLVFAEKSKSEVERNFQKSDHEITKINDKIKRNYYPKLQIGDT